MLLGLEKDVVIMDETMSFEQTLLSAMTGAVTTKKLEVPEPRTIAVQRHAAKDDIDVVSDRCLQSTKERSRRTLWS